MTKINQMNKIYQLYFSLFKKYGEPEGYWKKWCKKKKTKKDKEEIIISAILTQMTNWKNVELAIKNLKKAKVLSIEKIYKLGKKNLGLLEKFIQPSGFYKQKAKRIFQLCQFIIKDYKFLKNFFNQDLKICRQELLKLQGIGPETADSILLYVGEKPIFVIDKYTKRFVKKYKIADELSYNELQKLFEKNLPKNVRLYQDFHALIIIDGKNLK